MANAALGDSGAISLHRREAFVEQAGHLADAGTPLQYYDITESALCPLGTPDTIQRAAAALEAYFGTTERWAPRTGGGNIAAMLQRGVARNTYAAEPHARLGKNRPKYAVFLVCSGAGQQFRAIGLKFATLAQFGQVGADVAFCDVANRSEADLPTGYRMQCPFDAAFASAFAALHAACQQAFDAGLLTAAAPLLHISETWGTSALARIVASREAQSLPAYIDQMLLACDLAFLQEVHDLARVLSPTAQAAWQWVGRGDTWIGARKTRGTLVQWSGMPASFPTDACGATWTPVVAAETGTLQDPLELLNVHIASDGADLRPFVLTPADTEMMPCCRWDRLLVGGDMNLKARAGNSTVPVERLWQAVEPLGIAPAPQPHPEAWQDPRFSSVCKVRSLLQAQLQHAVPRFDNGRWRFNGQKLDCVRKDWLVGTPALAVTLEWEKRSIVR
jgi:hypothetical protein